MESTRNDCSSGVESETTAAEMDELSGVSGGGGAAGDDFSIDELLDFSNGYSESGEQLEEQRETEAEKMKSKTSPVFQGREGGVSLSKREDLGSFHEGELCVQVDLIFLNFCFFKALKLIDGGEKIMAVLEMGGKNLRN